MTCLGKVWSSSAAVETLSREAELSIAQTKELLPSFTLLSEVSRAVPSASLKIYSLSLLTSVSSFNVDFPLFWPLFRFYFKQGDTVTGAFSSNPVYLV